jgi:hypothetical protein
MTPIRSARRGRWLIIIGTSATLALSLAAASSKAGGSTRAADVAEGAISLLISKRCERSSRDAEAKSLEWNALVYARAKPPSWGRKPGGMCRGLDTWVISEALAAGVYWSETDHKVIEADPMTTMFDEAKPHAAFKKVYGWELPERGDDLPPHNVFLKFDSKKLSKLFDSLYVKPTDMVGGVTGQEVYDVFLKDFVTRFARETALINASISKGQIGKLVKDYQATAKKDGSRFRGPTYLKEAVVTALPKDQPEAARAYRTLGVVLRRTADGTWPIVSRLLKKVVADYDPALSQELAKKL